MNLMQDLKRMRKALTIGELLITMAIIGVIATLVLPGFMKDYHNKIYTTKLKKSIELIEIAVNQACIDNNVSYFYQTPYKSSDVKGKEFLKKYFKTVSDSDVFAGEYAVLKAISLSSTGAVSTAKVEAANVVKLSGGEAIGLTCSSGEDLCTIYIDINATDAPNKGGRDMFTVYLDTKTNSIVPNKGIVLANSVCTGSALGVGCYQKLLDNNWVMDY